MISKENICLWKDINPNDSNDNKNICHKVWNHHKIKLNNIPLFYKKWYYKGLKYVWQLFDFRIKEHYSFNDIWSIRGINRNYFIRYKSLTLRIPRKIIDKLRNNEFNPN